LVDGEVAALEAGAREHANRRCLGEVDAGDADLLRALLREDVGQTGRSGDDAAVDRERVRAREVGSRRRHIADHGDLRLLEDREVLPGVRAQRADDGDDTLGHGLAAALRCLVRVVAGVTLEDLDRAALDAAPRVQARGRALGALGYLRRRDRTGALVDDHDLDGWARELDRRRGRGTRGRLRRGAAVAVAAARGR